VGDGIVALHVGGMGPVRALRHLQCPPGRLTTSRDTRTDSCKPRDLRGGRLRAKERSFQIELMTDAAPCTPERNRIDRCRELQPLR
jgi:hypothetical protein